MSYYKVTFGVSKEEYDRDPEFYMASTYMDDEIREEVHRELAPCTNEEFMEEYKKRHMEKFGEEFIVN